ncbi:hypothetical protein [Geitlerinema sp. PCC 9228]|uniref:hypothetical protein n=1 Tax=Geitlerinema sp. PCC 9228 TaxID=111611 RepID=UPI00147BE6E1|nr:hypothetical protein [Geitlerinema sp. PCC 9228]
MVIAQYNEYPLRAIAGCGFPRWLNHPVLDFQISTQPSGWLPRGIPSAAIAFS